MDAERSAGRSRRSPNPQCVLVNSIEAIFRAKERGAIPSEDGSPQRYWLTAHFHPDYPTVRLEYALHERIADGSDRNIATIGETSTQGLSVAEVLAIVENMRRALL